MAFPPPREGISSSKTLHYSPLRRARGAQKIPFAPSSGSLTMLDDSVHRAFLAARAQSARSPSKFDQALSPNAKNAFLRDGKLSELLEMLRTDDFVGTIDPKFHSSYLANPDCSGSLPSEVAVQSTTSNGSSTSLSEESIVSSTSSTRRVSLPTSLLPLNRASRA